MVAAPTVQVDPVKYEVFVHRLWQVGEEGRIALQRVSASPIVVQGGESMSSFYDPQGRMILACSGHLRFAAATSDAIKKMMEWFGESPGFFEGDQIFFNDPYIAGSHTYDQMVVMPIFYEGRLIAWTASSTHTADVGGVLRGGSSEIFHEGIKIQGLKVVEKGEFRNDTFRTITEQCRDPYYMGLDIKSRIAANNVCHKRFLELVDKFGVEFVEAAGQKLLKDAEEQARAKLRALPDGTWRSRVYASSQDPKTRKALIVPIECTMTKRGDELEIDLSGTGPQVANDMNSTLPSTLAHVSIALTNWLFWDVPWNDGKMIPVKVHVPEGSILNCKYPAACGSAPMIGGYLVGAIGECLAKMLYAGGRPDDVNATWSSWWYYGGPGFLYGGHNREGLVTAQGLYDIHGGGLGAAPTRDGVDTGGHQNIPSGGISDVERIERQYPFLYFTRRHTRDGSGFGKYRGGLGSERLFMIYGSKDATVDFRPYAAIPHGSFGLFGGHPAGFGGMRTMFTTDNVMQRMADGGYPAGPDEVEPRGWGSISVPQGAPGRMPLPEECLVSDFSQSGGGYGDPLDRDPRTVARDVRVGYATRRAAERVYGVALDESGGLDEAGTRALREKIRAERLRLGNAATADGRPPTTGDGAGDGAAGPSTSSGPSTGSGRAEAGDAESVLRFHEYLEVARAGGELVIRCRRCSHVLCSADQNYKRHAVEIREDLEELVGQRVPSGEPYVGEYRSYACPGCATLLQVDVYCPSLGGETPLWDIQLDTTALRAR